MAQHGQSSTIALASQSQSSSLLYLLEIAESRNSPRRKDMGNEPHGRAPLQLPRREDGCPHGYNALRTETVMAWRAAHDKETLEQEKKNCLGRCFGTGIENRYVVR